ncbi:FtsW/RodA/SpoVE family cell cycle protein [Aliicoccus persicus]|uniref:Rod shape-determining protein RodA n=1 Tax=Aliicoccus persicus TaxID=930138 RepID=A0A662Z4L8_9STAP|nr:FtsW/RodA/SpoVE family cell cycle protein [Aliicoccus persicus]SEW08789.1 rod shape determining protein RodA [Aliicoccus persicus]HJE19692.1 rod shape-determining protein RodA [Aliicoccus persicus]
MERQDRSTREKNFFFARIDYVLIAIIAVLAVISVVVITSAMTSNQYIGDFRMRQIVFYVIGFGIAFVVMVIPMTLMKQYIWLIYGAGVLSLLVLFIMPDTPFTPIINGAQSWYRIGGLSLQPSEFVKIIYILTLAYVISQHNQFKQSNDLIEDFKLLFKMVLVTALPLFFILSQNDLGTVLVFIAIILGMVVVSGISWWLILPTLIVFVSIGVTTILGILYRPDIIQNLLGVQSYQLERIYTWLRPYEYFREGGFQLANSLQAIGSGGLQGQGYGQGSIYIPENHTDFIFTIIGEEFGFIGSTVVIMILFVLMLHLARIASASMDSFSAYFIVGYISMLMFQVFQNIGMTIQLLPITGLPLPFLSYGGTALWSNMLAIGIVLSIQFYRMRYKTAI